MGPLIALFWTSRDVCPGFQNQGVSLTCVTVCTRSIGIKSGANTCWLYRGQHGSRGLFDPCTRRSCIHKHWLGIRTHDWAYRDTTLLTIRPLIYIYNWANCSVLLRMYNDWKPVSIQKKSILFTQKHFVIDCLNSSSQVQTADQCTFSQTPHTF